MLTNTSQRDRDGPVPYCAQTRAEQLFCSEGEANAVGYRRAKVRWLRRQESANSPLAKYVNSAFSLTR